MQIHFYDCVYLYTPNAFLFLPRWANLKKRISLGKQRMGPYIQSRSETITADLMQFAQRYTTLHQEFSHSECLRHECDAGQAMQGVTEMARELAGLQEEACNLTELQELLGTSVFRFSLLNELDIFMFMYTLAR